MGEGHEEGWGQFVASCQVWWLVTGGDNTGLISRSTSPLSLLRLGSRDNGAFSSVRGWQIIVCYDFEWLTVDSRAVCYLLLLCQDIYIERAISLITVPILTLNYWLVFLTSCLSLKVQWLIAARSGEEADIAGNGMVVMLFLKKPAERRDESSLGWCWHHLIIRSDVNLRLHSIHTGYTGTYIHIHCRFCRR